MNWLLKKLGYRDRRYRGSNFCVRIERMRRDGVRVIYTCQGTSLNLDGQRIGTKWGRIEVYIPGDRDAAQAAQIARDLETAFRAMDYSYIIARSADIETVPE